MDRRRWVNGKITASLSVNQSRSPSDGDDGCDAHPPVVRQSQATATTATGSHILHLKDGRAVQNAGRLAQRTSTQPHEHRHTLAFSCGSGTTSNKAHLPLTKPLLSSAKGGVDREGSSCQSSTFKLSSSTSPTVQRSVARHDWAHNLESELALRSSCRPSHHGALLPIRII